MATGTEHYAKAEQLLAGAEQMMAEAAPELENYDDDLRREVQAGFSLVFQQAQVHATLATRPSDANLTFTIAGKSVSPEQVQKYTSNICSEVWRMLHVLNEHFPDGLPDDLVGPEEGLKRAVKGGYPWLA